MINKAKGIVLVNINEIKLNPKNRNKHPADQIERLVKIIQYQGFRTPVTISNRTGLLVAGHGRLLAAKKLKMKEVPAIYQDFDSDEQEIAHGVSDNAIGAWAELDLEGINIDVPELGPDFDIDYLGIKNFSVGVSEKIHEVNSGDENSEWVEMPEFAPGEGYIRLILQFASEENRQKYCEENHLSIDRKMNKQWIVNL